MPLGRYTAAIPAVRKSIVEWVGRRSPVVVHIRRECRPERDRPIRGERVKTRW